MHVLTRLALASVLGIAGVVFGQGAMGSHAAGQPLTAGWNELGVPTSYYSNASTLVSDLESQNSGLTVQLLATYANGHYALFVPGFSPELPLTVGEGVFVHTNANGSWTPQGTAGAPVQLSLSAGWNLLSVSSPATIQASAVCTELNAAGPGCLAVAHYAGGTSLQSWQFYSAVGGTDFAINPAEGIFVFVQHTGTWTPS